LLEVADTVVTDDPAAQAAERIVAVARAGGHIALAGGSTPRAAYEQATDAESDWGGATLWFGDDRAVPPDHEFSNYKMVKEALLDRITGSQPDVKRIKGELGYREAADDYERELRGVFGDQGVPRLDLILLGIGPDAHTASLFPNQDSLGVTDRLVVGVETPGMEPVVARVTLTRPVLNAAHEVAFLIKGEDKADAVARAFGGEPGPDAPASLVRPDPGKLTLLLDPAAAAKLDAAL
jgi:6-phosphogluconolactonase